MGKLSYLFQKYWLLPLLILLGYAGNFFKLPVFFGVDFIFGSIASLLVLIYYGLPWGLVSAAIAGSHTMVIWQHGYALLVLIIEALVVGLLLQKTKINLVLADGIYWFLIGMPLVYFFYQRGLRMAELSVWLITLKQATNGVFNSIIATLLIASFGFTRNYKQSLLLPLPLKKVSLSFEQTIFNLLAAFIFFPYFLSL